MFKKVLILTWILSFILTLSSCGLDYRHSLDENKHNKIEVIIEDDASYIVYQDNNYLLVDSSNLFSVSTYRTEDGYYLTYDDILLSWNGNRYIWYIDEYYSYSADDPLFIYNSRLGWEYFREDYDYASDTFIVKGTDAEIIWNDIFTSIQPNVDFSPQFKVDVYSKQCERIRTSLELAFVGEQWYVRFPDSHEIWIPSDEFIKILSDSIII